MALCGAGLLNSETRARSECPKWQNSDRKMELRKAFKPLPPRFHVVTGSRWSFLGAMLIIIVWAVLGPYFHCSDT
jgi:Low affinity iron permease